MRTVVSRWLGQTQHFFVGATVSVLLALLCGSAVGQEVAITHCQGSCPKYGSALTANTSKVVIHHLYAAGLNGYNRRADWVAYRLSKEAIGIASLLPRDWHPDRLANFPRIAELADVEPEVAALDIRSSINPYGGMSEPVVNQQNRMRLAPMTSYANTPYWSELNNTSNMLPMPAPLRLGAWLRLEQTLNALVAREEEIHVIAGPVYFNNVGPSSDSLEPGVNLAGYFKIVADASGIAAFVFPQNMAQHESFCEQKTSLDDIEGLTGLQMFPGRRMPQSNSLLTDLGCNH